MNLKLSHIALACPELTAALDRLKNLGLAEDARHEVPTEKVRVSMVPCEVSDQFRIELLEPTDPQSPIAGFLAKKASGGIHHLSFEVDQIEHWEARLKAAGLEILPPGIRKAARGKALFLHPKSMGGVLVELEEIS
jgi:methylmalonyl-CoA/ethylmalonyl-CoA epimerase